MSNESGYDAMLSAPDPVPARRNQAHRGVKQSRDRAQYVRQQKPKSVVLHWLVLGIFSMFIVPIYYTMSPNYFWKL